MEDSLDDEDDSFEKDMDSLDEEEDSLDEVVGRKMDKLKGSRKGTITGWKKWIASNSWHNTRQQNQWAKLFWREVRKAIFILSIGSLPQYNLEQF